MGEVDTDGRRGVRGFFMGDSANPWSETVGKSRREGTEGKRGGDLSVDVGIVFAPSVKHTDHVRKIV